MTHSLINPNDLNQDLVKKIFKEMSDVPVKDFLHKVSLLNKKYNGENPNEFSEAVTHSLLFLISVVADDSTIPMLINILHMAQAIELKDTAITSEELLKLSKYHNKAPSYVG